MANTAWTGHQVSRMSYAAKSVHTVALTRRHGTFIGSTIELSSVMADSGQRFVSVTTMTPALPFIHVAFRASCMAIYWKSGRRHVVPQSPHRKATSTSSSALFDSHREQPRLT